MRACAHGASPYGLSIHVYASECPFQCSVWAPHPTRPTHSRAIEVGSVLLIENLDDDNMDDFMEQVLSQRIFLDRAGRRCLKVGDTSVIADPK